MPGDLLPDEGADQLVSAARTAMGDQLRSVTFFTRDDFEQVYLREDLERDTDFDSYIGHEWRDFETTQSAYERSELGEYHYTVRAFENGYLLRVTTDRQGVFVTAESITLRELEEVATALGELLAGWESSKT